ncbi:biotin transporter BioY [Pararhizobium mangrovi]|uniref:Biotin transporter n=1 Tax=Pararhizobium mangrovi TaxID=2590452 RepID=A0A506UFM6_9HYPH|nr:biotin transporter BioY [Pararhizobium mangrovi]TPW30647.1 biotin transporter BioY [Pararhizobium mangrovi]
MTTSDTTRSLAHAPNFEHPAARFAWYATLAVLGTLVLTVSAKTRVVFGPVDLSLETLAVFAIAATFGMRLGVATLLLYLAEGASGLPVFQASPEHGIGLAYMMGPTGGYLAGFVVAAIIVGYAADRGLDRRILSLAPAVALGEIAILGLGFAWLSMLIGPEKAWQAGVVPFIAGDLIKAALVVLAFPAVRNVIERLSR